MADSVARQAVADLCDGLPVVGRGQRATLYRLADGRVLKLYYAHVPDDVVQAEFTLSQAANRADLPSWIVRDLIVEGGWRALLGEFVEGVSVSDLMRRRPWRVAGMLADLARLQGRLHAATVDIDLPARLHASDDVCGYLRDLPAAMAARIQREVSATDDLGFCHGDFHGGNVMVLPQGMIVIDWDRGGIAPPAIDVARTLAWLILGPSGRSSITSVELALRSWLAGIYLSAYCRQSGRASRPIRAWLMFEIVRRRREVGLSGPIMRYLKRLDRMLETGKA